MLHGLTLKLLCNGGRRWGEGKWKMWKLTEHFSKRSLAIICNAKIKKTHSWKCPFILCYKMFYRCIYILNMVILKISTFNVHMAQFCTSIDLLWLTWDGCFLWKACCDLIRLLKNKGQETPNQHKAWWNKNHHLHIQPLFFSCLWAKLAIRGSVAKVINSIACVVQTHLKKKGKGKRLAVWARWEYWYICGKHG